MNDQFNYETICGSVVGRRAAGLRRRSLRMTGMAAALLALGIAASAQSADQSLADVARQKPTRKAARVVTNDEIPSVIVPVSEPASRGGSSDAKEASDAGASSSPASKDPGSKSKSSNTGITVPGLLTNGTVEQAKATLESLKHDRQLLLNNYDKIEKKMAETNDDSLRQVYSDSLARRDETLARNDKAIADMENAIRSASGSDAQGGK